MRTAVAAPLALAAALAGATAGAQDARWIPLFSVRAMGGGALVAPSQGALGGEFAGDLTAGVRFFRQGARGRAWHLGPELGFAPLQRGEDVTVLWQFGLAAGYGTVPLHVSWTPRFVVGAVDRDQVVGLRHGILLTTFAGLACVEVAHQYLRGDTTEEHDLRVTVGVDMGMIAHRLIRAISGGSR
jgi:hypothetical protein